MKLVTDFGDLGQGNDAAVFQLALDHARLNKESLRAPPGVFTLDTPLNYITDSTDTFYPGLAFEGEGADKTILIATHNQPVFNLGTTAPNKFHRHGVLEGFTVKGGGTAAKLAAGFHYQLNGLQLDDQLEYGLWLPTTLGDADASNNLSLEHVRIDNAAKWGIFGQVSTGVNELSFLSLRHVFLQACGTAAGEVGGGMYWRGQMLSMEQVAFVLCENRGLYIEGGAGLGSDVYGSNVTFENNTGKHIQCYGVQGMVFDNLQMYSNDTYKTQYSMWVNAGSSVAANILVRSGKVRATAGNNPHIAFCGTGANLSNAKAQNISWDNYGHAGQTKMVGFTA
jgi:hypothetical protein